MNAEVKRAIVLYAGMPMHYPAIFMAVTIDTFQMKVCYISLISCSNHRHGADSLVAIAWAVADDVLPFHYLVFSPDKTNQSAK